MREAVRIDAFALDQAGIAEGGLLARLALVHQQDRPSALLQMHGNGHADDPGSENNHILTHEGPAPSQAPSVRKGALVSFKRGLLYSSWAEAVHGFPAANQRSEERRVGKEC